MPASRPPTTLSSWRRGWGSRRSACSSTGRIHMSRRARCRSCAFMRQRLPPSPEPRVLTGTAEQAGLTEGTASLVVAEATLTLNAPAHKQAIAAEAFRILRPGGRYAIHGLAIVPDGVADGVKTEIETTLSRSIHVGAGAIGDGADRGVRPLSPRNLEPLRPHRVPHPRGPADMPLLKRVCLPPDRASPCR